MMKPSLPQGTRDFSAAVVRKRNYILSTIRTVFENYGFQPLETPAMENLDTLMGKYGEEGDKLIFKILNNGLSDDKNREKATQAFQNVIEGKNDKNLTERALRYDLTIPFARYVAMNFGQLTLPYKRYQIQPVWRADRPQRGRYREFYQCDADVVGSKSLLNEAELTCLYADVFAKLNIDVQIKINNRKILAALAEVCGGSDKLVDITVAIDKLDKIGIEKVKEELSQRGLEAAQISIIEQYLLIDGSNEERLQKVTALLQNNETGRQGIDELKYIISFLSPTINQQLTTDFTLARGLSYYTGIIFEIKANDIQMGSIGGGGRYDDLTGLFGVPNVPGVGISFGVDRIYDVMEEKKLFPDTLLTGTEVLFFNLGEAESKVAFNLMQQLRNQNIACEIFGEASKFDKQFKYAEKKNIPYIIIIGSEELQSGNCKIKNLRTGIQQTMQQEDHACRAILFRRKADGMKYDITHKSKTMRYLLCCVVVMSVVVSSCHRRSVPERSTAENTKPVTPVYSRALIIVDARGNFAVTEATLPADASKEILNPANARAYTPAQTKTLAYRFGKVPPRILYVPASLQKKSARGTYYVLDKKFWYWRKSNGYFYIDENYFK